MVVNKREELAVWGEATPNRPAEAWKELAEEEVVVAEEEGVVVKQVSLWRSAWLMPRHSRAST